MENTYIFLISIFLNTLLEAITSTKQDIAALIPME